MCAIIQVHEEETLATLNRANLYGVLAFERVVPVEEEYVWKARPLAEVSAQRKWIRF
jgi:hypothetical protein